MSIATVTPLHPPVRERLRPRGPAGPAAAHPVVRPVVIRPAVIRPAAVRRAPASGAPLRLTGRGRRMVRLLVGALVALVVLAGVLGLQRVASAGQSGAPATTVQHVVLPGETLWSIARQEAPGEDVRDAVARIIELNALPGGRVFAGQRIAVEVR